MSVVSYWAVVNLAKKDSQPNTRVNSGISYRLIYKELIGCSLTLTRLESHNP